MFFKQDKILAGYPPKTRDFLTRRLQDQGISLHPAHHVEIPNTYPLPELEPGELTFTSGQHPFQATCILWVSGAIKPNSDFIPDEMLNEAGFVTVNPYLQSEIYDNIFAIGDIAASDPNRSSVRNAGFKVVAKNIEKLLSGQHAKMRPFRAPKFRWGSIIGLQKEGMRIFTPQGGNVKVGPRSVKNILFPIFVRRLIYRGIRKKHLIERP